jgi:cytochrome c556
MKRLACVVSVLALLAVLALVTSPAAAQKDPSIKEIMTKAHKGNNSIIASVGGELRGDDPDWPDVQKQTKELVTLGMALGKNDPPKGDKDSWQRLTQQYVANAKALDAAAQRQDKTAAQAVHKKLTSSCAACHKAHRPS